ncbi:MAG: RDD family protein [bacterium]|nr:RDD family protein [bacterium]
MARFGGRLIDFVIFWALLTGVLLILHFSDIRPVPVDEMDSIDAQEAYQESVDEVLWAIVATWAVYEFVMTATRGQTLGKMATRTRVIRADDVLRPGWDRSPGWSRSFVRLIIPIVLLLPVLLIPFYGALLAVIGYLSIIWDGDRQGWHDKAAKTLVVSKP